MAERSTRGRRAAVVGEAEEEVAEAEAEAAYRTHRSRSVQQQELRQPMTGQMTVDGALPRA